MLYNDQPIGQDEEDKLNRKPFVDEIVELVDRYTEADEKKDNHDGLVIGLEGDWGSGKTSILNLLENRFKNKNERYVVQRLDSWLALDCVTLTVEFFKTLGAAALDTGSFLDGADYVKENAKKIPKGLMNLAKATGLSISTPFVSFKPNWEDLLKEKSLRIQKKELKKTLSKSEKYIIYMIDDIDRLNSKEIAFVMQLVKNIADFPKVIYILSYDREIVTEALQRIDGKNGRDFMEKIIQVPIRMPEFGKADLLLHFRNELRTIIQSESSNKNKVLFDTSQRKVIMKRVYMSIDPYLKNLRDCKRLLNAYQIRYFVCSRFCDADDLLCIVLLEVFEPGAISYLINHYDEFYPSELPGPNDVSEKDIENYRDGIKQEANCSDQALKILASLFPSFAKKIDETSSASLTVGKAVVKNKISERENFPSYFILSPNENAVFSDTIKDLLLNWQEEQIVKQLKNWSEENKLKNAFLKVRAYCDLHNQDIKLERERWTPILRGVSSIQNICPHSGQPYSWIDIPWAVILKIIDQPTFAGDSKSINMDTAGWVVDIFRDSAVSLETLETIMWHVGAGYDWEGPDSYNDSLPEVSEDIFIACKDIFMKRLRDYIKEDIFFDSVMKGSLLSHLMQKNAAYLKEYLDGLSTIGQIFSWLNYALREEKENKSPNFKGRIWHHDDDLLAIMPESYTALVDTELNMIPEDWLEHEKWPILVLYYAYVHQISGTRIPGKPIKDDVLKEYADKIYRERNKILKNN